MVVSFRSSGVPSVPLRACSERPYSGLASTCVDCGNLVGEHGVRSVCVRPVLCLELFGFDFRRNVCERLLAKFLADFCFVQHARPSQTALEAAVMVHHSGHRDTSPLTERESRNTVWRMGYVNATEEAGML